VDIAIDEKYQGFIKLIPIVLSPLHML